MARKRSNINLPGFAGRRDAKTVAGGRRPPEHDTGTPSGVDFIGIIFHKQGPNGRDVAFVNEYQQNIGEQNRKYATVGDSFRLPAGVYSVYIIAWGKRETMEHRGNLTEYFAQTTLTVK
jgi:hypothetical protein